MYMENLTQKEIILAVILIVYLVVGFKTPEPIANLVDTIVGKVVIMLMVVYLFVHHNPILAVLALYVGFDLIRRSSKATGFDALRRLSSSEDNKHSNMATYNYNHTPYTLEQEMVNKMAPLVHSGSSLSSASYRPVLEDQHDATDLNE